MQTKNFRKRALDEEDDDGETKLDEAEQERRMALEEVKFLQRQRDRKSGIPAMPASRNTTTAALPASTAKNDGDNDKEELVLQDTFAQETAVTVEDPNMMKYVEQELAKKRGKIADEDNQVDNNVKRAEDQLYIIPEHLKVKRRNSEESSTQWTTGIAEIQLPIEYKLRNIEETEAAKKLLQVTRPFGHNKSNAAIPCSYNADYNHRSQDHVERLSRDYSDLVKDRHIKEKKARPVSPDTGNTGDPVGRRLAASDDIMLDRFRKRERNRKR